MTSKGINIPIAADTKAASTAIQTGLVKPLEDSQAALEKLGTSSKDLDSLEKGMKGAQQATEQENKTLKESVDNIQSVSRAARQGANNVKQAEEDSTSSVELSTREQTKLKREALKEGAAQAALSVNDFSGSATEIAESAGSAIVGIAATMPGIGLAIGAAASVGLGIVSALTQKADEQTKQFKEDVADLAGALIDAGKKGGPPLEYLNDQLKKLATETDDSKVDLDKLQKLAKTSGSSYKDLAQAVAGNTNALKGKITTGKAALTQDQAEIRVAKLHADQSRDGTIAQQKADLSVLSGLRKKASAQGDLNDYLQKAADKAKAAAKEQKLYIDAGGPELQQKADQVKTLDDAYADAASDADAYLNKEGKFDPAKFIKNMAARAKALDDYNNSLNNAKLSTDAKEFLSSLPPDVGAAYLKGYMNSSPKVKAQLAADFDTAGKAGAEKLTGSFSKAMKPQTVKVKADTTDALKQINNLGKRAPIRIPVVLVTRNGQVVP